MGDDPEEWEELVKRGKVAAVGALRKFATEQIARLSDIRNHRHSAGRF